MKKNYETYITYGILVLVVFILVFAIYGFLKTPAGKNENVTKETGTAAQGFNPITSGSTEQGDVSIELTPSKIANNQLTINIAVNTHSVDLPQFNLKEITFLQYEGKTIKPASVPDLQGHHSNGEIVFDIKEKIKDEFTITIKEIPKVENRVFTWKI